MSNTPSTDTDPWDRPLDDGRKAVPARHKEGAALSSAIPDDWDEETSSGEEDSQIVWDNANKQVPMPQLVATSPRTGSISPGVVPPASAFQSPIRILKRATAPTQKKGDASDSSSSSSPASALMSAGTFAERSARYNAARERIFAAGTTEASAGMGTIEEGVTGGAVSAIIRNPKGPEPAQGPYGQGREGSQGFGIRTGERGSSGRPNEKQGRQLQDSGLGTE
ncbi:hypothetical protein V8E52_010825 [Russula decolorans]